MRPFNLILILPALLLCSLPVFSADPSAQIDLADGTSITGTIDLPAFVVKTDYGFLTVPTSDVLAAWPGFPAPKPTLDRIDLLMDHLKTPALMHVAANELRRIGRPAVPPLQQVLSSSNDNLVQEARSVLHDIRPHPDRVNPNRDAIVATRAFVVRGQLTFKSIRVMVDKAPVLLNQEQIRLIKFTPADLPEIPDWPKYPEPSSARPDLEVKLTDGSRIRGQLDHPSLNVNTVYGLQVVPLKSLVSVHPTKDPARDEVVTQELLLIGAVDVETFNLTTKMGAIQLPRSKFDLISVLLSPDQLVAAPAPAPVVEPPKPTPAEPAPVAPAPVKPEPPAPAPVKPAPAEGWKSLFNGKDLKGWRKWGTGTVTVAQNSIVMDGECGLSYEGMKPVNDLMISAEVKLIKPGITKLALRETAKGLYQVEFQGDSGTISHWDNENNKNIVLKQFKFQPTADQTYRLQFGALGQNLLAFVNDTRVAAVKLADDDVLPAGSVNVSIWHATSAFRAIEIKPLD